MISMNFPSFPQSGGGGTVTGSGTTDTIPIWTAPTVLGDSLLHHVIFNGQPCVQDDENLLFLSGARRHIIKQLNSRPAEDIFIVIDDTLSTVPMNVQANFSAGSYFMQLIFQAADVLLRNDIAAGTITIATNSGQVIIGQNATPNDMIVWGKIVGSDTIKTGDPGAGAGEWLLGQVTGGVTVPTQTATVQIDGQTYSINVLKM